MRIVPDYVIITLQSFAQFCSFRCAGPAVPQCLLPAASAPGWLLPPGPYLLAPTSYLLAPSSWPLPPGSQPLAPGSYRLASMNSRELQANVPLATQESDEEEFEVREAIP